MNLDRARLLMSHVQAGTVERSIADGQIRFRYRTVHGGSAPVIDEESQQLLLELTLGTQTGAVTLNDLASWHPTKLTQTAELFYLLIIEVDGKADVERSGPY